MEYLHPNQNSLIKLLNSSDNFRVTADAVSAEMPLGSLQMGDMQFDTSIVVSGEGMYGLPEFIKLQMAGKLLRVSQEILFQPGDHYGMDSTVVAMSPPVNNYVLHELHSRKVADKLTMDLAAVILPRMAVYAQLPVVHMINAGYMWIQEEDRHENIIAHGYHPLKPGDMNQYLIKQFTPAQT